MIEIQDDEELEYPVGPPPAVDQPDDRTVLCYRRIRYSERRLLIQLFQERGRFDDDGYYMAVIATGLTGWRHYYRRSGLVPWPGLADETPTSGMTQALVPSPQAAHVVSLLPEQQARLAQMRQVLALVERMPLTVPQDLAQAILSPSPETLLKNLNGLLTGPSTSPAPLLDGSIPAGIADANAAMKESPSLATAAA